MRLDGSTRCFSTWKETWSFTEKRGNFSLRRNEKMKLFRRKLLSKRKFLSKKKRRRLSQPSSCRASRSQRISTRRRGGGVQIAGEGKEHEKSSSTDRNTAEEREKESKIHSATAKENTLSLLLHRHGNCRHGQTELCVYQLPLSQQKMR